MFVSDVWHKIVLVLCFIVLFLKIRCSVLIRDIDLMVIGSLGLRDVTKLLANIEGKILREINPHVYSETEFIKKNKEQDHFVSQIIAGSKIFIIGRVDELKTMVG